MKIQHLMKQLLVNDKEGMNFEDFKAKFYRSLRMRTLGHNPGQFDELLEALYNQDNETYKELYNALSIMTYGFVKRNTGVVIKFVNLGNAKELDIAFKMIEYQTHLVDRNKTRFYLTNAQESKRAVLEDTKKALLSLESDKEDNILIKAQDDFAKRYVNCLDNPNLCDLYNELYDGFKDKIEKMLANQLSSVDGFDKAYTSFQCDCHANDTLVSVSKNKHGFKSRKRVY